MNKFLVFIAISFAALTSCKKHDPVAPVDPLTSISLGKDTLTLYAGGHRQINFTTSPGNYSVSLLTWHSSDTTIASVNSTGIVTAKNPGISKITVSNKKNSVWTDCLVFVIPKPVIPPVDSLKIGLLARYDFNDSGVDSSGHGYDGTVYNITSATDRFGNVNGAYSFDGISSYIAVPDQQSLRLNNTDFTLNAWVKVTAYGSSFGENILTKRYTGADNGWTFGMTGYAVSPTGVIAYGPGGGSINAYGTTVISLNQWHMLTIVYSLASQTINTYIDGALKTTVTGTFTSGGFVSSNSGIISPNASITALMYIGKDDPSVPANGYFFNGSMDDIRIYGRAISKNQIQQLYMANN